ncbi:uncharacterized protein LOC127032406 isoform X9 [Gopherus flavomarginatus]|uniref:uncharacterized protein LOC127032406 isoform X9 n=1 Tax=Gopherus flavomarginatus TaxID=286002 RepID=UPI0021CBA943|nr:uncharacterized protein LOC127032406 isoform X9 [Gopherus flavomarginatus]
MRPVRGTTGALEPLQAGAWVCGCHGAGRRLGLRVPRCKQAAGSAGCGCHGAGRRLGLRVAGATVQAGGWVCGSQVPRCRQAAGSAGATVQAGGWVCRLRVPRCKQAVAFPALEASNRSCCWCISTPAALCGPASEAA